MSSISTNSRNNSDTEDKLQCSTPHSARVSTSIKTSSSTPELHLTPVQSTGSQKAPKQVSPDDSRAGDAYASPESDQLVDDKSDGSSLYMSDIDLGSTQALLLSTKVALSSQSTSNRRPPHSRLPSSKQNVKSPVSDKSVDTSLKTKRPPKRKLDSEPRTSTVESSATLPNGSRSSRKGSIPPFKRPRKSFVPRTSLTAPNSLQNVRKQHPTFWFLDGSVIIEVEDTQFRLTRSRLALASPFFETLFAEDDKGDEIREMKAGCPVYPIEGVNVLDFERLLTALEKGITYALDPPHFLIMAAILRAASALSFSDHRKWAIGILEQRWSSELPSPSPTSTFRNRIPWAVETIVLGYRQDVPQVLKAAFYELVRARDFQQLEDDGPDLESTTEEEEPDPRPEEPKTKLPTKNIYKLVALRESLRSSWLTVITRPPDVICPKLEKDPAAIPCSRNQEAWLRAITGDTSIQEDGFLDPITALEDMIISVRWVEDRGFCESCVKTWKDIWTKERQKLWDNLDVWLDLV